MKGTEFPQVKLTEYINEKCPRSNTLFTDASFNPHLGRARVAFYNPKLNHRFGIRVSKYNSIIALELLAIRLALQYALSNELIDVVILTDSKGALELLKNPLIGRKKTSTYIQEIVQIIHRYGSY